MSKHKPEVKRPYEIFWDYNESKLNWKNEIRTCKICSAIGIMYE